MTLSKSNAQVGDTVTIKGYLWPERAGQVGEVIERTPRGIITVRLEDGTETAAPHTYFTDAH